ncbi:MAG TPA: type II secretion system protein [Candidatus Paceibacterota bacterium]|nr:type II secretion system protein [Candidatus Paceibacterota bacterium]HMO83210.1 type II secretion system protein [Candidatus Paceibacterota bacterium]
MMFYQQKESGFSLVETLVAISILLIVIVGPMTISMQSAKSASFASEQVQAFFLAQEGLELAQKARDELLLNSNLFGGTETSPWGKFSTASAPNPYHLCHSSFVGCGLIWNNTTPQNLAPAVDCTIPANCRLHLRNTDQPSVRSHFSHTVTDSTPTPFTRRIYFESTSTGEAVKVRSVVTWRTGSIVAEQKVEVDTYLYNIYDTP